jgi:ABC-type proline/glycine betaine transport system permease subunit
MFIGATDLWILGMKTLSTVSVSVLICFILGVPLGIMAAYNKTVDTLLKPVLDTMQTLPVFVYLVPVIMLFGAGQVSSVLATVVYALPPLVRCTTLGIRELPGEIDEVSNSFGANMVQTLTKIKIPMAIPAIMVGVNQAIMMALAMEVVTPLIGGQGLGMQVFDGMNRASLSAGGSRYRAARNHTRSHVAGLDSNPARSHGPGLIYLETVDSTKTGIGSIIERIPPSVGGSKKYDIRREENTICHFELEQRLLQRYWR